MKSLAGKILESLEPLLVLNKMEIYYNIPVTHTEENEDPDYVILVAQRPLAGDIHGKAGNYWYAKIDLKDAYADDYIKEASKLDAGVYVGYISDNDIMKYGYLVLSKRQKENLKKPVSLENKKRFLIQEGKKILDKIKYKEYKEYSMKIEDINLDEII